MPLDLTAGRAALTEALQNKTLSVTRDGVTLTSRCGCSPRSGSSRREDAADVERGEYRVTLPAGSDLVLQAGEIVTVDGRRLRITWAPLAGNLALSDQYGATEVR